MLNYFDIILNKMQLVCVKMVKGQVFRATTQKLITQKKMKELLSRFKFIYYIYKDYYNQIIR